MNQFESSLAELLPSLNYANKRRAWDDVESKGTFWIATLVCASTHKVYL